MSESKHFPAPFLAHWVTGAVPCCQKHCQRIVGLGAFTGSVVAVTENPNSKSSCANCHNEAIDDDGNSTEQLVRHVVAETIIDEANKINRKEL